MCLALLNVGCRGEDMLPLFCPARREGLELAKAVIDMVMLALQIVQRGVTSLS